MYNLGHIQPAIEQVKYHDYFTTITLPKCHYRKGPTKQMEVARSLFKRISTNYFESAYGCTELTKKGNIHIHAIVTLKNGIELPTTEASARMMSAFLKPYSNCDFQVIKNIDNVYNYVYKDIETMKAVLKGSPCLSWEPKPNDYINKIVCEHGIHYWQDCCKCYKNYGLDNYQEIYD